MSHLLVESLILVGAAVGTLVGWRRFVAARVESRLLKRDLEQALEEAGRWREESRAVIQGLGEAIRPAVPTLEADSSGGGGRRAPAQGA